jgi:uncharacterized protein DUF5670
VSIKGEPREVEEHWRAIESPMEAGLYVGAMEVGKAPTLRGFIHILLLVALAIFVINLIQGRRGTA